MLLKLIVPPHLLDAIITDARAAAPAEVCGMLAGRGESVEEVLPVRNQADDPQNHFLMDPVGMEAAQQRMDDQALTLIGYYHSHPRGAAQPSRVGRASLVWPDLPPFIWLIVSLETEPPTAAAFCTKDATWAPVPLSLDRPSTNP